MPKAPPSILLVVATGLLASACSSGPHAGASAPSVARLIVEGRSALEAGAPEEAERLFQRAAELDEEALEPRLWTLRAWMDQGRSNATLDAIDQLGREGRTGPEMDYLYGMAFARRAEGHLAAGVTDASVQMNFEDAVELLDKALEASPERFRDAHLALARAAWRIGDLERARGAVEQALTFYPEDPNARLLLGRVAFSQFVATKGEQEWGAEAEAHWSTARDAFAAAVEGFGEPRDANEELSIVEASVELGNTLMWKGLADEAQTTYANAISWAPEAVDYATLVRLLDTDAFRSTLERGAAAFDARSVEDATARDASLRWWLGYARLAQEDFVGAEEAFRASVEKEPGFLNAWFYVAKARYGAGDYDGATRALRSAWELDPSVVVDSMKEDQERNLSLVSYMVGQAVEDQRLDDAAFLSMVCAETALDEPRYWSDLGLFLRDEGERIAPSDPEAARRKYEGALTAYERALELAPDDPQVINDTAVVLHYYLERELGRALTMYARAKELATLQLEAGEVPADELDVVETALRDATDNLNRLQAAMSQG